MQKIKRAIPWWLKLGIKVITPLAPVPKEFLFKTHIFKHGEMQDPEYALKVFHSHYDIAKPYVPDAFSILELGPGDSLATSVISTAYGASKVYLVDVAAFARVDGDSYNPLLKMLNSDRLPKQFSSLNEMMEATNCTYLVNGLASLREIPTESIDISFSHSVLEHVYLDEFEATIAELFRVMKSGGISSHSIDLKDHFDYSLNSLRFSHQVWESQLFRNASFYTNRLRVNTIVDIFECMGFEVLEREDRTWEQLPLPKRKLHADFQKLSDTELCTSGVALALKKP